MNYETLQDRYARLQALGILAPLGECQTCDLIRENEERIFPAHKAYSFCRSYKGGRSHCTCDTCF